MAKFIITYDICEDNRDEYSSLIDEIKKYPKSFHIQDSVWIVKSSDAQPTIRTHLKESMKENDRLFVALLPGDASWINLLDGNDSTLKTFLQSGD
jgi:CRISPR/Cas system-associated endoribonuclease Cas2